MKIMMPSDPTAKLIDRHTFPLLGFQSTPDINAICSLPNTIEVNSLAIIGRGMLIEQNRATPYNIYATCT